MISQALSYLKNKPLMGHRQWQKKRWNDYAPFYYKDREKAEWEGHDEQLADAVERGVKTVLDVGCGGGIMIRRFKQMFPQTHFIGIDFTVEAVRQNTDIDFVFGDILNRLYLFDQVQMFYTYCVFMHLDEKGVQQIFDYVKGKKLYGLLFEPFALKIEMYGRRDYRRNYMDYIEREKLISFKLIGEKSLFGLYYFTT